MLWVQAPVFYTNEQVNFFVSLGEVLLWSLVEFVLETVQATWFTEAGDAVQANSNHKINLAFPAGYPADVLVGFDVFFWVINPVKNHFIVN